MNKLIMTLMFFATANSAVAGGIYGNSVPATEAELGQTVCLMSSSGGVYG